MSIRVMTKVWDECHQKTTLKFTLLAIADHCDDEGVCWPSVPRLAEKVEKSERQVQYDLRKLENAGELVTKQGKGRTNNSRYFIITGLTPQEIYTTLVDHPQLKFSKGDAQEMVKLVVAARKKVQSTSPEKVQSVAPEPSSPEPSINEDVPSSYNDESPKPLAPVSEKELLVFSLVNEERKAKGYRAQKQYQTLAQKKKLCSGVEKLDAQQIRAACTWCFEKGSRSLASVSSAIAKWRSNGQPRRSSTGVEGYSDGFETGSFATGVGESYLDRKAKSEATAAATPP